MEWTTVKEGIPELKPNKETANYYLCWNNKYGYPCVRRLKKSGFDKEITHWCEILSPWSQEYNKRAY